MLLMGEIVSIHVNNEADISADFVRLKHSSLITSCVLVTLVASCRRRLVELCSVVHVVDLA